MKWIYFFKNWNGIGDLCSSLWLPLAHILDFVYQIFFRWHGKHSMERTLNFGSIRRRNIEESRFMKCFVGSWNEWNQTFRLNANTLFFGIRNEIPCIVSSTSTRSSSRSRRIIPYRCPISQHIRFAKLLVGEYGVKRDTLRNHWFSFRLYSIIRIRKWPEGISA